MTGYVIRRVLLMVPTFLGIALLLFVVLNLAPGRPGRDAGGDLGRSARSEQSEESYRIFREQFHLDLPVLLNTRGFLDETDVLPALRTVAGLSPADAATRIAAEASLEDLGAPGVALFGSILRAERDAADPRLRDAAAYFLRLAALRPLRAPFDPAPPPEVAAENRAIDLENARLRPLRYALDAPEPSKQRVIGAWLAWLDETRDRQEEVRAGRYRALLLDTRFARYLGNLARLDLGVSLVSREPVLGTLASKLRYSVALSVGSLLLAYLVAVPLGIFSAVRKDTREDRVLTVGLFMLYSLPTFFVATLLLHTVSQGSEFAALRLFPTGGFESPDAADLTVLGRAGDLAWHLVLPMFCLTYGSLAALSRYMRSGLLEVIRADFIRTARAKGLPERLVIGKHALRNGLLPIVTLLAGLLPAVLGGSVVVEYIFGIPGMGLWTVEAIYARDYNVIMAVELCSTVLVLVGLLLTDIAYALVDPRIRYS